MTLVASPNFRILAFVLLSTLLFASIVLPMADGRQLHGKQNGKQQIKQSCTGNGNGDITCLNTVTAILCEHAICIIGNISPFLISIPH
jgi:hypothetical protein